MYKNVFFDLDGTLLDTLDDIRLALNDALKECNFSYSFSKKECHSLIGHGANYLIHQALKEFDDETNFIKLKQAYMWRYQKYQLNHIKPYNGVEVTLKFLFERDFNLFVVTNKPHEYALELLKEAHLLNYFKDVLGQVDGENVKPDPHFINHLVSKYNLKKEEGIFVGDSITDYLTAKNSSLDFILCMYGYGSYKLDLINNSTFVVKKFSDIVKCIYGISK